MSSARHLPPACGWMSACPRHRRDAGTTCAAWVVNDGDARGHDAAIHLSLRKDVPRAMAMPLIAPTGDPAGWWIRAGPARSACARCAGAPGSGAQPCVPRATADQARILKVRQVDGGVIVVITLHLRAAACYCAGRHGMAGPGIPPRKPGGCHENDVRQAETGRCAIAVGNARYRKCRVFRRARGPQGR